MVIQNQIDESTALPNLLAACTNGIAISELAASTRKPEQNYTRITELLEQAQNVATIDTENLAELLRQTRPFNTPAGLKFQRALFQQILASQPNRPSIRSRLMAVELMLDGSPTQRERYHQAVVANSLNPDLVLRYLTSCNAHELARSLNGSTGNPQTVGNGRDGDKLFATPASLGDYLRQTEIAIQISIQKDDLSAIKKHQAALEEHYATSAQAMTDKKHWDQLYAFEERIETGLSIKSKLLTTSIANLEWYYRWFLDSGRYSTDVECAQWFSIATSSARSYAQACANIVADAHARNPGVAHLVALELGIETISETADRIFRRLEKQSGFRPLQDLMHNGLLPALPDESYLRLARMARKEKHFAFSLRLLDRCTETPDRESQRARLLYDTNQLLPAIEIYGRLLDAQPSDTDALRGLISTRKLMGISGDIDARIDAFLHDCRGKPEYLADLFYLGVSLKRHDLIVETIRSALETGQDIELLGRMAAYMLDNDDTVLGWQCAKHLEGHERWHDIVDRYRRFFEIMNMAPDSLYAEKQTVPLVGTVIRKLVELAPPAAPAPASPRLAILLPSIGSGGIQRQVFSLLNSFVTERRFEAAPVVMPMSEDKLGFYQQEIDKLNLVKIPAPPEHFDFGRLRAYGQRDEIINMIRLLPSGMAASIGYFLENFIKYDVSIAHCWYDSINCLGGVAAVLAGSNKVILGARSVAPRGRRSADPYMYEVYKALLERPSVTLTTLAASCQADFLEWLGIPPEKVQLIYNGIELGGLQNLQNPAKSSQIRHEMHADRQTPVFGSAFRFSKEKRPLLMLEAAAEVVKSEPHARFVLVGDGRLRTTVEAYARQLGIADNLVLPGVQKDIIPWIDAMDVVVLLSTFEGTANIAIEAQALGKPVVLTDVGGLRETFVDGQTGTLLAQDPSPQEVAHAMLNSWREFAGKEAARKLAIAHVRQRFSPTNTASKTAELYFT